MANRMTPSFDYDDLVSSLQIFMRNSDDFRDVNWDGSAAKALLRVLAYNTQLQQSSNGFLFNELSLDTATIRKNVASIASSMLGYLPKGKRSAVYMADIIVTPKDGQEKPTKLILDRSAKFFAAKEGVALNFTVDTEYETNLDETSGQYIFKNVKLVQGKWISNSFLVQTENGVESYTLPNKDIDADYMKVGVLESDRTTDLVSYKRFESVFDLGSTANVYFISLDRNENYKIEFGDDRLCRRLKYGNIVIVESLTTDGDLGNNASDISVVGAVGGFFDVEVVPYQRYSYGGADQEDIETIKKIAPLSFAAQGNAVSNGDFVALTKSLFSEADSVVSWGGEENDPPKYGYQMVAVKPKNGDSLNSLQKLALTNILGERCVGSISPIIVDPDFTYLNINTEVLYAKSKTVLSEQSLRVKLIQGLKAFSKDQLEFFDSDFIYSKLVTFINSVDGSFLGNVTTVTYSKKFTPVLNVFGNYTFNFKAPIKPGSVLFKNFKVLDDSSGWDYNLFDLDGKIYISKTNPDTLVGGSYTFPGSIGTVDYVNGVVRLSKFRPISILGSQGVVVTVTPSNIDPSLFNSRASVIKIDNISVDMKTRESVRE